MQHVSQNMRLQNLFLKLICNAVPVLNASFMNVESV